MLCRRPFRKGVLEFGCGQCMPCRINRSRQWIGRMLLESMEHPASCFITLTYREERKPKDGNLSKRPLQLFMKKLRQRVSPRRLRFYGVGEYGEKSWRPHYHVLVFGLSLMEVETIKECWCEGFVHVGEVSAQSIGYVTGYMQKNMRKKGDPRLGGRTPEFCMMSLKPALGSNAIKPISESLQKEPGAPGIFDGVIQIGRARYMVGRTLRDKVNQKLGVDKEQKKAENRRRMLKVAGKKFAMTTIQYEAERKARVVSQGGKFKRKERVI